MAQRAFPETDPALISILKAGKATNIADFLSFEPAARSASSSRTSGAPPTNINNAALSLTQRGILNAEVDQLIKIPDQSPPDDQMKRPGFETRLKRIKTELEETSDEGNRPTTPAQPPGFDFAAAISTTAGRFPHRSRDKRQSPARRSELTNLEEM